MCAIRASRATRSMAQHTDLTAPDWAPTPERQRELLWAMICRIDNILREAKAERRARRTAAPCDAPRPQALTPV
jgi:hypothetical protein